MKEFINLFDRLYQEIELQKNVHLCDKIKVECRKDYEFKCRYCVDRDYYESYYNVYEHDGKYTVTQQHRAAQYPRFENKSVEYATIILFLLLSRYIPDLRDSENARRFWEEHENDNNTAMKKLLVERFGYLLSFGEKSYNKISICQTAENITRIYYHNKFVDESDKEIGIYVIAYNACVRIEIFRKLLPKINKVVPLNYEEENSKLEFLFVSGKNEDTALPL